MIWSNALRKYSISIAGGGQLNMDSLYSSYKERYDAAIERIDKESPHRICLCWVICKISLLQKSEGMAATIPFYKYQIRGI
jgi:hypothetical protein